MSKRELIDTIHELEAHGVVVICGSDNELDEAVSYELDGNEDDDN